MWKIAKLGEICTIQPKKAVVKTKLTGDDEVSFLPMENLGVGQKYPSVGQTKHLAKVYGSYTYFENHDVLLAKITPCFENGKLGIANNLVNGVGFGSSEYIVFRCGPEILPEYLYYFLDQPSFRLEGQAHMSGAVGHKRVSKEFIANKDIPLPQLAEQQRIVTKLDAAFEEIDRAVARCKQQILNTELIYTNKLSQIFENKGSDWVSCSLSEITSKIGSGATPRGGKSAYKDEGISLIRSMNVYDMDFSWRELAKIDDEQAEKLSSVTVGEGDVLLNITGASVARCTMVPTNALPARVNQHVAIVRVDKTRLTPKFLAYGLVARVNKDILLGVGNNAGATRQAITKKDIEDFVFYFPKELDAQKRVVDEISNIKRETLELARVYKKKQENLISLKSAILAQELQPPQSEAA